MKKSQHSESNSKKTTPFKGSATWLEVGEGFLAIGPRPKLKALPAIKGYGCTHVISLLGEQEDAQKLGRAVKEAGMEWIWVDLPNGRPPTGRRHFATVSALEQMRSLLRSGNRLFIHCAAGLHRTGMITYGLLRFLGFSREEALEMLMSLREETAKRVGEERLGWGEHLSS